MKLFSNKLDIITLVAVVIIAISITLLNFNDLSWQSNTNSYVGLIMAAALIIIRAIARK